ncbi:major facilitator superfamily domain-containing protein [Sporodiniella umbellata]|nr:major facilitator superfamily domain-containing protein [Sporodiniella umbellata]
MAYQTASTEEVLTTSEKKWSTNDSEKEERDFDENQVGGDTALANAPWKYKLIALVTALCFPIGSHFSQSALSAMKAQIKTNLHINNTQYGVISSSVSIINTIFPILGGIFVDVFGSVWGTLAVNFVVIVGSLLTAIAAKYQSFGLMVAGRVIFGIGSGLIVTMQESILSKWFRTQNLAIAIGLQLSISRLATFLGTLVANPIAKKTGDWVWAFWLSFIICGFSILMNIIYAITVRHLRNDSKMLSKQEINQLKTRKKFDWKAILKFPAIYWQILLIEFIFAAVWSAFQTINTELVQVRFNSTGILAGYTASASQTVPIVATPILGVFMDVFGGRVTILLASALFLILSFGLLGWAYISAVVGMVFYSISLAFGPISMITSIGMVLPSDYIGTGLGMYKSANNVGTSILDIVVGVIQDHTKGGAYTGVMILFLVLACVGFVLICGLWVSQYFVLDNLLEARRNKRMTLMKERNQQEIDRKAQGEDAFEDNSIKWINWIYLGLFVSAIIVAWVLFFVYAAGGGVAV